MSATTTMDEHLPKSSLKTPDDEIQRKMTTRLSVYKKTKSFMVKYEADQKSETVNTLAAPRDQENLSLPESNQVTFKDDDKVLNVTMTLDRNPSIFDYKVFFAINELCSVDFKVEVSPILYKPPAPFDPNGIWFSEIRSVVRAMDYYESDEKFQRRISYRTMLYICYINFFMLIIAAVLVPITSKDSCGNGLYWRAHYIMAGFLFINFVMEVSMFFICMPFDILKEVIISSRGDLRDNAWTNFATLATIAINSWFLFSGIIAKVDIYTDIAFALEVLSCGYPMLCVFSMIFF